MGLAGLIFDADFDRDGWNELGQITRGTYGDVPVMIYDPGGTQDIIPGPSHPIQDPTEGDPSLLINRAMYANVNGEMVLTDFRIERVRVGTGLQFHTFEPVAPLAMIGSWVADDKQGPVLQFSEYPTWPIFVGTDRIHHVKLFGNDAGGSGITGMNLETDKYGDWLANTVHVTSFTGQDLTFDGLTPKDNGELNLRIQGIDHVGNLGPWSAPIHFNTYEGHINLQTRDVMGRPVPDTQITRRNWQLTSDRTDAVGTVQGLVMSSPREGEWITFDHPGYKTPPSIPGLTEYDFERYTIMDRKYLLPADDIFNHGDFADSSWPSDWTRVVGSVDRGQGALRLGSPGYYYEIGETYVSKNVDLAGLVHPVLNLSAVGWLKDATFRVQIKNQQGVTDLMVMDSGGITTTAVYTDALTEYTSGTSGRPLYTFDLTPWAAQKVTLIISFHTDVSYSVDAAYVGHISLGSWTTPVIDSVLISQSGSITNVLELGKSATITVTGQNFLGTPTLRLGQTALISVTVTGESQITATIPATLGPGIHTLWITNPDKTLAALPTAAIVGKQIYLPLLSRCTEDPFMCR